MKNILAFIVLIFLLGCEESITYDYYIASPADSSVFCLQDTIDIVLADYYNQSLTQTLSVEVDDNNPIMVSDFSDTIRYAMLSLDLGIHTITITSTNSEGIDILDSLKFTIEDCYDPIYKDGNYRSEFISLDSHGFKAFLEFSLLSDILSNVTFDYLDSIGLLKSEDSLYNAIWMKVKNVNCNTHYPLIEISIASASIVPELEEIDVVSGATASSINAYMLLEAGLNGAIYGDTLVILPQYE